jgi:hypothetical protein
MIPREYDVGNAARCYAVGTGIIEGEPVVIVSGWDNTEKMDNLSMNALSPAEAAGLGRALIHAADNDPPDYPRGTVVPITRRSGVARISAASQNPSPTTALPWNLARQAQPRLPWSACLWPGISHRRYL